MGRRLPLVSLIFVFALIALWHARSGAVVTVPVTRDEHMEMTIHGSPAPGDQARGDAILAAARAVVAKYANVADAERDGYAKFLPNIPLPIEHYTNGKYAIAAAFGSFDPNHPTSIIYKRTPGGLVVVGVMYTAPNRFDASQLDARVPLSLGTWHRHVDFCAGPNGSVADPRFGFAGTIDTQAACEAAGGRFIPRVFNWMVHVWPLEHDPAKIWAVDAEGAMSAHHDRAGGTIANQTTLPISRERLPAVTVDAGDVARGAAIFAGNCASCHGAGGANGPDAPRLAGAELSAGQVAYMVRHPKGVDPSSEMPELGLSDRDVADVAAYVAGLAPVTR
jgi:mono/diheme cytochrome c family protein